MKPVVDFLKFEKDKDVTSLSEYPRINYIISKGEMIFEIRAIYFADRSYEIMISDVSRLEKRRLIKQQLTANIAHELKTPVASMKGYLETIKNIKDLPEDKRDYFIERAYLQSERLSALLNDISLLNNIEEAGDLFEFKEVAILPAINDVFENQHLRLKEKGISYKVDINENIKIHGNYHLITSISESGRKYHQVCR
jgi:signal transduction histidine kinase